MLGADHTFHVEHVDHLALDDGGAQYAPLGGATLELHAVLDDQQSPIKHGLWWACLQASVLPAGPGGVNSSGSDRS